MAGRPLRRKRMLARKRRGGRDESRDWRGHKKAHKLASQKGWKSHAKRGWKPARLKGKSKKKRDMDGFSLDSAGRDARKGKKAKKSKKGWFGDKGHGGRHARAASRGWFDTAKPGWKPARPIYKGSRKSTAKKRSKKRDASYGYR